MSTAFQILALVVVVALMSVLLQKTSPAFSLLLSIGTALFLVQKAGQSIQALLKSTTVLAQQTNGQAFSCLVRCTGVLLLTDYVRSLCVEADANSLGWCAGLVGRCLVLAAAWPLISEISQMIWGLAG